MTQERDRQKADPDSHRVPRRRIEVGPGIFYWPGRLDRAAQQTLLGAITARVARAPFFRPRMKGTGTPFSVEITNFGSLGWVSDQARGYRYEQRHPETGQPWPDIPRALLDLWDESTGYRAPPECCLVNLYRSSRARMGLHRDADEAATDASVLSVSLGDDALFRIGGLGRRGATRSFVLGSGDVLVFGGPARLCYHGIDRIVPGSSDLVAGGGRINLTLRRVSVPGPGGWAGGGAPPHWVGGQ